MKLYLIIITICLFYNGFCIEENTPAGVKFILNEKLINLMLSSFYGDIQNNINTKIPLPDIGNNQKSELFISGLTKDKIKFEFMEKGDLNLTFTNLNVYYTGFNIFYNSKFNDSLGNLCLQQKVIINSVANESGIYLPKFEFNEEPKLNLTFNEKYGDGKFANKEMNDLLMNQYFNKYIINIVNETLNFISDKIPKEVPLSSDSWVYVDLNMIGPIEPRNKSIQITSYGFLYNKDWIASHNLSRYSLSNIPSIKNDSHQLYISAYSMSSAIYSLLTIHKKSIVFNPNYFKMQYMFPRILEKFKNCIFYIIFNGSMDFKVELMEGYMNVIIPGTFEVKASGDDIISLFKSQVELTLNAELFIISYNHHISANVNDLSLKTIKIETNIINNDTYNESVFQIGLSQIKEKFIEEINKFIKSYLFMTRINIMNIELKNIKFEHKKDYIIMNFDYIKGY